MRKYLIVVLAVLWLSSDAQDSLSADTINLYYTVAGIEARFEPCYDILNQGHNIIIVWNKVNDMSFKNTRGNFEGFKSIKAIIGRKQYKNTEQSCTKSLMDILPFCKDMCPPNKPMRLPKKDELPLKQLPCCVERHR